MIKITHFSKFTIELTTLCNLKCAGCPRTVGVNNGDWINKTLSLDNFEKALKHLPKINMVTLHGIGEPTLNPEFINILKISKAYKKFGKIKITSNGLAKSPDYYRTAIESGLDEVWISVDSLNQSLASSLRENTDCDKLIANINRMSQMQIPVYISMTVSSENFRECMATSHLLCEIGAKGIFMQEFQDFGNSAGVMSNEQRSELLERFVEHKKRYPNDNISPPRFITNSLSKKKNSTNSEITMCSAPWSRPAMNVDGYMTPCCTTFDPSIWGYLSLYEMDWKEIYSQENVRNWLKKYINNAGDSICEGCALNPKYDNLDLTVGERSHQAPARI